MTIRFYCEKCRQPIEVDDTDAGKNVLCFYCREQNKVPTQSDPALATGSESAGEPLPGKPVKSRTLGLAGFVSALAMVATLIFYLAWGYGSAMVPAMRTPNFAKLPPETQQKMVADKMNEVRKQPLMRIALVLFFVLLVLGIVLPLAGIFTGRGTNYAIVGFVITVLVLAMIVYLTYLASRGRA